MRIIGGHDYYDSGLAYGQDESLVFLRNGDRRETDARMHEVYHLPHARLGARFVDVNERNSLWEAPGARGRLKDFEIKRERVTIRFAFDTATVVLCGKLYRGLRVKMSEAYGSPRDLGRRWMWNADAVRAFAAENGLELDEGRHRSEMQWVGKSTRRQQAEVHELTLGEWFEPVPLAGKAMDALVRERVTIAFLAPDLYPPRGDDGEHLSWRIDQDGLRDIEFAKAVDPYTAFQEISMWKGGVLPSDGPQTVEITDDKVKIAKHGFHHPTSFRRAKGG